MYAAWCSQGDSRTPPPTLGTGTTIIRPGTTTTRTTPTLCLRPGIDIITRKNE